MLKDITGFDGYKVSICGTVYGKNGKSLKHQNNNGGKLSVGLYSDGKINKRYIHRIVATEFIDNPHNKPQVDHIDGDNSNNHADNLRWCTNEENQAFRDKQGNSGAYSPSKRISYDGTIYSSIRELSRILAERRKCSPETVRKSLKATRHGMIKLYGKECYLVS